MRVHDIGHRLGDDGAEPPAGVAVPGVAQMPQRAAMRRLTVARETPVHVAWKEADTVTPLTVSTGYGCISGPHVETTVTRWPRAARPSLSHATISSAPPAMIGG